MSDLDLVQLESLSERLSKSALIPDSLKGRPGDILAVLLTGSEIGLQPMQALRSIVIIKGKPTMSAELMLALVRRRTDVCQYLQVVVSNESICTMRTQRVGEPSPTEISFTAQEAQQAGLSGDNWRKFRPAMLRARCGSAICKAVYSDLLLGVYDSDSGELTNGEPLRAEKEFTTNLEELRARALMQSPPEVTLRRYGKVEKDVTPTPEALPALSGVAAVKAKLQEESLLPVLEASLEAIKAQKGPSPFEQIKEIGAAYGLEGKALSSRVKGILGSRHWKTWTASDVETVRTALASTGSYVSEEPPEEVPLPRG